MPIKYIVRLVCRSILLCFFCLFVDDEARRRKIMGSELCHTSQVNILQNAYKPSGIHFADFGRMSPERLIGFHRGFSGPDCDANQYFGKPIVIARNDCWVRLT